MTNQPLRFSVLLCACLLVGPIFATAQIQVTSTNPSAAPQGSTNLNVTISGSGFKRGATAQWFVHGTTNPGGVTVNSTIYNGSSSLTANLTIADTANTGGFDVVVTYSGRTGVGSDAFTVTQKGTPIGCNTTGTPTGFTLQGVLNPVQPNGAALITTLTLGNAIRVRPLDLDRNGTVDTLVAFVTSGNQSGTAYPGTYVFFLDPVTGLPQATNPITGAAWQNPLQVLTGIQSRYAAAGDVNGDGIPDFALASPADGVAYLFVGAVSGDGSYTPSYNAIAISRPVGAPTGWAKNIVLGDLNVDGNDEIAIGAVPSGRKDTTIPAVFVFQYTGSGVTLWETIQDPTGSKTSDFSGGMYGGAVAIGNITGGAGNDLAVGADAGGTSGVVYVFPYPASQSNYFTLSGSGVAGFGEGVGIADVNIDGFPDLVVNAGGQKSGQTFVFAGTVHAGSGYTNQLLPATGLSNNWALPGFDVGNLQSAGAVAIGTPNASNSSGCPVSVGAMQLFTSPYAFSQQPNYVFEPPTLTGSSNYEYGYNVGVVPGYPILLISEHYQDVGTTSMAGQVYVYTKNP